MSRNKSPDFFESLNKMSHFGAVRRDDFETAQSEYEQKKLKIQKEKQEKEETIKREKEEKEKREYEDYMFCLRLQEDEELRTRFSPSHRRGVGRGKLVNYNSPFFEPANSFASPPPSFHSSRPRPSHRTPTHEPRREVYEDSDTIQPYLKQKPVSHVEKVIGGYLEKVHGPVNPFNNRNIVKHFRPEEAEQRHWSSDQHYKEQYEALSGDSMSSSSASLVSSASTSPRPSPVFTTPSVSPPPVPRTVRKKGTKVCANFSNAFETEEDREPNNNEEKPPHITDICGSSSRSLVHNGRKFASGPSINRLNPSCRIFDNAVAQAVSSTHGEFLFNKDEFPSLSGR